MARYQGLVADYINFLRIVAVVTVAIEIYGILDTEKCDSVGHMYLFAFPSGVLTLRHSDSSDVRSGKMMGPQIRNSQLRIRS